MILTQSATDIYQYWIDWIDEIKQSEIRKSSNYENYMKVILDIREEITDLGIMFGSAQLINNFYDKYCEFKFDSGNHQLELCIYPAESFRILNYFDELWFEKYDDLDINTKSLQSLRYQLRVILKNYYDDFIANNPNHDINIYSIEIKSLREFQIA